MSPKKNSPAAAAAGSTGNAAPPGTAENPVVLDEAPASPMKTIEIAHGPNVDGMDKQAQNAQTRVEEE